MANRKTEATEGDEPELVASELDELTHRELGHIYDDSTRTIIYSKGIQWKAVASTLVIYIVIVALAKYVSHGDQFMMVLKLSAIVMAMAATFMLVLFQFWQHTEARKLAAVESSYSSLFRKIRRIKSKREADFHRYIILLFMVGSIVLGCVVTLMSLGAIAP